MRKKYLLLIASLVALTSAHAQLKFQKVYGGAQNDEFYSIMPATDGGYIFSGQTTTYGAGDYDACLVKTDAAGNLQWTKIFGGLQYEIGMRIKQTADNGYMMAGWSSSFTGNYYNIYFIKTDSVGTVEVAQQPVIPNATTAVYGFEKTTDGGYIATGLLEFSAGQRSVFLLKIDSAANLQWAKSYGGPALDAGWDVKQTFDGGYIVVGYTWSFGQGNNDVYLIKTNAGGDTLWTKTYGGSGAEGVNNAQVLQTPDSGFIIATNSSNFGAGYNDGYLLKTDKTGNLLWSKTYGGSQNDYLFNIRLTNTNGYIITGRTHSAGASGINGDAYAMKTDSAGNIIWIKRYSTSSNIDGLLDIYLTPDNGYFFIGHNRSTTSLYGAYMIKTDSLGNSGCNEYTYSPTVGTPPTVTTSPATLTTVETPVMTPITNLSVTTGGTIGTYCFTTGIDDLTGNDFEINVFPNPAHDILNITLSNTNYLNQPITISVYDIMGKQIFTTRTTTSNLKLQTSNFSKGIYFVNVITSTQTLVQKFVKE